MANSKKYESMLIESVREGLAIDRGEAAPARTTVLTARDAAVEAPRAYQADKIRAIRAKMKLSQDLFARTLNVSGAAVRAWEQGAREPDGASLRLLEIAERNPGVLLQSVQPHGNRSPRSWLPNQRKTAAKRGRSGRR